MKPVIGVNFPRVSAERLEDTVKQVAGFGFEAAEYNLSDHPLIVGGTVCRPYVEFVKSAIRAAPLVFTAHIGTGLNLRNTADFKVHKDTLFSSIDICDMLDMRTITVHYEDKSMHVDIEQAFLDVHLEAAEYAQKKGVLVCIENIEIDHYQNVLDMVKTANHQNFRMTLDLGHLNLSTNFYGQVFLDAVRECAPYVRHLHISDNTGHFEKLRLTDFLLYATLPMGPRIAFGSGDIHIPPFWGVIDIMAALRLLKDAGYDGIFLCEYYNAMYNPFNKEIQENVRNKISALFGD